MKLFDVSVTQKLFLVLSDNLLVTVIIVGNPVELGIRLPPAVSACQSGTDPNPEAQLLILLHAVCPGKQMVQVFGSWYSHGRFRAAPGSCR